MDLITGSVLTRGLHTDAGLSCHTIAGSTLTRREGETLTDLHLPELGSIHTGATGADIGRHLNVVSDIDFEGHGACFIEFGIIEDTSVDRAA